MVENTNRRTFLKAAGLAGLVGLAGGTGTGFAQQQQTRLSWHAGGTGGTYFPLSNEIKTIVEENTDFTLQVQSTGASVENVGSLAQGQADFALIQNDIAYFAYNGTGIDVFEGSAIENLQGVATLYPETIHIVTMADSGIETLEDLEGATINTGDLGSGTQVNALQMLQTAGITPDSFTEQNTGFSQAADQLRNGDIDAAFIVGGWPVGAVEELATTNDVSLVSVSGDTRELIKCEAEWFADDTIPAGTYNGVDEDVETVSVQAMIATHADVPEETVEQVTAAIFDNTDALTIKSDFISADSAQDGMSIPLHPGAEAYFGTMETTTETTTEEGTETTTEEDEFTCPDGETTEEGTETTAEGTTTETEMTGTETTTEA